MKKMFSIILTICIFVLALTPTVDALSICPVDLIGTGNDISPKSVIFPEIYDGPGGKPYYLIFSMTATNVNNMLNSSVRGKSFVPSNYTQKGAVNIHLLGTLTQTNNETVLIGLTKLNIWGEYALVTSFEVSSGKYFDKSINIANSLNSSTTYYACIENIHSGTVSGNMGVYYSLT